MAGWKLRHYQLPFFSQSNETTLREAYRKGVPCTHVATNLQARKNLEIFSLLGQILFNPKEIRMSLEQGNKIKN